ncbi:hypothetical protein [Pseudomonas chlororaphis]|uniref:hypothetical protein n=1 Tax=Pseudomonas chlororaphis TaxID=587753 RepID=UPI0009BE97A0|nr:hypothetical protein [Pseudomonas chlororaphis]QIT24196.1 hypothetical protein HCN09_21620 [Pseudomonas chlororaphis subsp. aurantiaca]WDH02307.1 hypothetical protein PUP57_22750 [Pseudomonas chlororaphis]WDH08845.1 hypothetical protein PUP64_24260 [Pseudomonas chlororaphis]
MDVLFISLFLVLVDEWQVATNQHSSRIAFSQWQVWPSSSVEQSPFRFACSESQARVYASEEQRDFLNITNIEQQRHL